MNLLIPRHWDILVKILDVSGHELGSKSGDHNVEEHLGNCHIEGGGVEGPLIVNNISSFGETDVVRPLLLW